MLTMNELKFLCKTFQELTTNELYELLALRSEVFVVEQQCVYQDVDGYDQNAHHLLAYRDGELAAYTRLLAPGVKYPSASLGRVVNRGSARGTGIGKVLVREAITNCHLVWPDSDITISAQQYLEGFYKGFGFMTESESYLEDDIPHIQMRLATPLT